jgi:transposase InsO family protein/transposase-like protein
MYSQEQRREAVRIFIESGKSHSAVIGALGYGSRWSIDRWYQDYLKDGFVKPSRTKWHKFTDEQKLEAVRHYLGNGRNLSDTVKELGYPSRTLLALWVDGLAPGMRKRQRKRLKYTREEKVESVVAMSTERASTIEGIAAGIGVDKGTLHNWRHEMLGREAVGIVADINDEELPDDVDALKDMVASLKGDVRRHRMEAAVWAGAAELVKKDQGVDPGDLTNREKATLVDALRNEYPLDGLLDCVGLARSSYYYQRSSIASPDKYLELRGQIRAIFEGNDGNWGYRRIWGGLRSGGKPVEVSEKVVRKIMREEGLEVVYAAKMKRHWSSYAGEISEAPENLVQRDFHADEPDALWLTDITQFTLPGFKCYLSPIIDCFDGKVVSWTISQHPDAELANTMLKDAIETLLPWQHPIIHSDRGCHYRWPGWIGLCDRAGLTRSMSKKGCSPDNSACEGFFGRLKNEFFYHRDWRGIDFGTFASLLDGYITYYNEKRIKGSLGFMSPIQYRQSLGLAA